jgi:hypothetical protein
VTDQEESPSPYGLLVVSRSTSLPRQPAGDNEPGASSHLKLEEKAMATKKAANKRTVRTSKSGRGKSGSRKYSPSASGNVKTEMREMKKGKLRSGRSGKKVKNPKQAIAIGLSKARKEGKKVPAKKS